MTQERVAVVTGATRGVGKGIAVALGETGHTVYVTGRSTDARSTYPRLGGTVEQTAREVTAAGGRGVPVVCDHTDDAQVRALFDRVGAESGRLDVLVNNVWGGYAAYHEDRHGDMGGPFWEQPLRVWDEMFTAGVRAHYTATVLAVPLLRRGGLVATVSFFPGSYLSGDDQVAYSVAKAADDRMVAVMAAQLAGRGVTAVSVYPGLVRTEAVLAAAAFFDLTNSESPVFVGRAVAALAADPQVARHSGRALVAAELAQEYGFTDVDGARPSSARAHFAGLADPTDSGPADSGPTDSGPTDSAPAEHRPAPGGPAARRPTRYGGRDDTALVVVLDCADLDRAEAFWCAALGYTAPSRGDGAYRRLLPADGDGIELLLQRVDDAKVGKNRMHVDLRVPDLDAEVARLVALGARRATAAPVEEDGWSWWVLLDPDGNEFCVLRPPAGRRAG